MRNAFRRCQTPGVLHVLVFTARAYPSQAEEDGTSAATASRNTSIVVSTVSRRGGSGCRRHTVPLADLARVALERLGLPYAAHQPSVEQLVARWQRVRFFLWQNARWTL